VLPEVSLEVDPTFWTVRRIVSVRWVRAKETARRSPPPLFPVWIDGVPNHDLTPNPQTVVEQPRVVVDVRAAQVELRQVLILNTKHRPYPQLNSIEEIFGNSHFSPRRNSPCLAIAFRNEGLVGPGPPSLRR